VAHLSGNLLFLLGPDAFNRYSHRLISNPLIDVAEGGLRAAFVLDVLKTTWTFASNRRARPDRYAVRAWAKTKNPQSQSLSSTTMMLTGTLTLLFVITHLITFKFGTYYQTSGGVRDLHRLQLEVFSSAAYVGVLSAVHVGDPFPSVARRLERRSVARRQQPAVDASHRSAE
jgi:succinate dehydrogenase / fumarate reductase cytochrome b subunit